MGPECPLRCRRSLRHWAGGGRSRMLRCRLSAAGQCDTFILNKGLTSATNTARVAPGRCKSRLNSIFCDGCSNAKRDRMNKSLLKKLRELTPAERIELAEDLRDSIEPEEMPLLTEEQEQEIERRYAAYIRNPDRGSKWEDVKTRLLARYR